MNTYLTTCSWPDRQTSNGQTLNLLFISNQSYTQYTIDDNGQPATVTSVNNFNQVGINRTDSLGIFTNSGIVAGNGDDIIDLRLNSTEEVGSALGAYNDYEEYVFCLVATYTVEPFSVYFLFEQQSHETTAYGVASVSGTITEKTTVYKRHTHEGSMLIYHYGTDIRTSGKTGFQGNAGSYEDETGWTTDSQMSGAAWQQFNTYYQFDIHPKTTYTIPESFEVVTGVEVSSTYLKTTNFNFLGTTFPYTLISQTMSIVYVSISSTRQVETSWKVSTGTIIRPDNSVFTKITYNNISPLAGMLVPIQSNNTLERIDVGFVSNSLVEYNSLPIFMAFSEATTVETITSVAYGIDYYTLSLTHSYTSEGEYQTTDSTDNGQTGVKAISYFYDGNTSEWQTEQAVLTYSYISSEGPFTSSSSNLNSTETIFTSASPQYTSSFSILQRVQGTRNGILSDGGIKNNTSFASTNIPETTLSTGSSLSTIPFNINLPSISTQYTETQFGRGTVSKTFVSSSGASNEYSTAYVQDYKHVKLFTGSPPTIYGAKCNNQERLIAYGHIYDGGIDSYVVFRENPPVFNFKNRRTYNATKFIKNNGIFSHIKLAQEEKMKFPLSNVGETYGAIVSNSTNSNETTATTYQMAKIARVTQYPSFVSFVLPESMESGATNRPDTWILGNGSNFKYTQYKSNGDTSTYDISYFFDASARMQLEYAVSSQSLQIETASTVMPYNSVRQKIGSSIFNIPDYVSFKSSDVFSFPFNVQPSFETINNKYSFTKIASSGDEIGTTDFDDEVFSTSDFLILRKAQTFCRTDEISFALVSDLYPSENVSWISPSSFLNFTNYFGAPKNT